MLAAAPLLATLLDRAPGVTLLVTSRTPVGLPAERVYPVPPLALPEPGRPRTLAELRRTEAIRLFVERARETRPDFELSDANADAVARICIGLDGLPLALELAAARSNLLSPRALLDRLGGRLDLLTAQPGSVLAERHQTLRAAIEWSYDLLEPDLQELFTSLAVFVGGFTLDGAEAVASEPRRRRPRRRRSTAAKQPADEPGRSRRRAARRDAGDNSRIRPRAARATRRRRGRSSAPRRVLCRARRRGRAGAVRAGTAPWVDRLDAERDNLRAAMDWARASGDAEVGLRIAGAAVAVLEHPQRRARGAPAIEELLAIGSASPATTATAQAGLAALAHILGDHETVRQRPLGELAGARSRGQRPMDRPLAGAPRDRRARGRVTSRRRLLLAEEELDAARRAADPISECLGLFHLGVALAAKGELADGERALEAGVQLATKLGNARAVAQWRGLWGSWRCFEVTTRGRVR